MAVPVVLAGLLVASAIGKIISSGASIYQTYETTKNSDVVNEYAVNYSRGYYNENTRFWEDYIRRHHLERRNVRYPYRVGENYNLSSLYAGEMAIRNNEINRNLSWFRLLGSGGVGQGPTLYRGLYGGD